MTSDEIWRLPPSPLRDSLLGDLSRRWRCIGCRTVVELHVPAVIGCYCCPGCGYTLLRPWHLELPPRTPNPCFWCDEDVGPANTSVSILHIGTEPRFKYMPWHRECLARSIIGGVNHQQGNCYCCGGDADPDPPGLTKREAAIMAFHLWELTHR